MQLLKTTLILLTSQAKLESAHACVEVGTVDQYQGRDKLVIIYSCTRSNDGRGHGAGHILLDTRRLNVAVTRAKAKLVIVGDRASLSRDYAPFVKLSSFFKESDVIKLTNNEIDSN